MGENQYITYTYENIQMGPGEVGCEDAKLNSGSGYSLQVFLGVGVKPRAPLLVQLKSVSCTRNNPTPHISLLVIRFMNLPVLLRYGSLWPAQWWRKETFMGKPEM